MQPYQDCIIGLTALSLLTFVSLLNIQIDCPEYHKKGKLLCFPFHRYHYQFIV